MTENTHSFSYYISYAYRPLDTPIVAGIYATMDREIKTKDHVDQLENKLKEVEQCHNLTVLSWILLGE